jgi:hypothetical protein
LITSRSILLVMRNVADKNCRGNPNAFYAQQLFLLSQKSYRLRDNVEKCITAGQATDDNMAHENFTPGTTNAHSEYVTLIALLLQQGLHKCASMLRLYVRCLSCFLYIFQCCQNF